MANTYVINSVTILGDQLTVQGTVNGTPVTVSTWVSAAGNSMASAISFRNFIAPLMLAAVPSASTTRADLTGTFSQ
jgi:molybdopterin biosynthesis enzyme